MRRLFAPTLTVCAGVRTYVQMHAAQTYIENGPPYFGTSQFSDVHVVKKAGGRWNPEKKQWKAFDESTLKTLIETGVWHPEDAEGRLILVALRIKHSAEEAKRDTLFKKAVAKRAAPVLTEQQLHEKKRRASCVEEDSKEELDRLWTEFGITQEMVKPTFYWVHLGPRAGLSDAHRVLRGIKFNLVTKEDVQNGMCLIREVPAEPNTSARKKKKEEEARKAKTSAETALNSPNPYSSQAIKQYWATASAPDVYRHDDGFGCGNVDGDGDQACTVRSYRNAKLTWASDTKCTVCKQFVTDQFMECHCFKVVWSRCPICKHKYMADPKSTHNTKCGCTLQTR